MLEMLAVMAIAGLLGIGSVEGYQAAVRKNQVNNILEGAAQRAIAVSQQVALDKDLDNITLEEFPTDAGRGATFPEKPKKLNDEFFSIPVGGLDDAACKQLQMMAGGALRRVDCNETNGSVTADLIYHKDLSETAGDLSGVKTDGSGSGNSATHAYDNNREGCNGVGYQYCADGTCITKEETCEGGSDLCNGTYPGTSEHNTGGQAGTVDGKTCRCPGSQAFNHNDKKCIVACSGHGTLDANEDCVCQGGYTGEICETQVDCGEHGTWTVDKCQCDSGWYGPLCDSDCDGFKDNGGKCFPCSYDYFYYFKSHHSSQSSPAVNRDECHRCTNNSYPRLFGASMFCHPCAQPDALFISQTECNRCLNTSYPREYNGSYCIPSSTVCDILFPEGWFRNEYGDCHQCSYDGAVFTSQSECDNCSNREMGTYGGRNRCVLTIAGCNALYPEGGVRDNYGNCESCSDAYAIDDDVSQSECDKCSNREMGTYGGRNRCVLTIAVCNALYPEGGIRDNYGTCYSCSDEHLISATKAECDKCLGTGYPREMWGGRCVLSSILATPCDGFRIYTGTCYPCSYSSSVSAIQSECDKCLNTRYPRKMDGDRCVKNW